VVVLKNKFFIFTFIFALSILSITTNSYASYKNEPEGFRGLPWGTNFSTIADSMTLSRIDESYGGIKFYTRTDDDLTIGSASLQSIEYGFWQDKFCSAYIFTNGYSNWNGVQASLVEKFGSVNKGNPYVEKYGWFGENTTIISNYNNVSDNGCIIFDSEKLSKSMENWSNQKSKEGAKTGF
jgi:hypothetical protein